MKELLSNCILVTGLITGLLTLLDWFLPDKQKRNIGITAEKLWYILAAQRSGRFIYLVRSMKVQRCFSILVHLIFISLLAMFLSDRYVGTHFHTNFQMGHPRIYNFQVFIEIAALLFSMLFVSKFVHPGLSFWISEARTLPRYFGRLWILILICIAPLLFCLIVPAVSIWDDYMIATSNNSSAEIIYAAVTRIEMKLGGKLAVILIHALNSIASSLVFTEYSMFLFTFILSIYWVVVMIAFTILYKLLEYSIYKVAVYDKGPLLAIAGLTGGIGAVIKLFA
ncbi:hypothetical protein [Methylobacterium oryzisoli]|uniref:hypothetical protein n=1 Tax=Methylobacterium oryzisoli TaxID=3385502 RepID=UPI003891EF7F